MRFSDHYAEWRKARAHLAASTLKDYDSIARIYLLPTLGQRRMGSIKKEHLQTIVDSASLGRRVRVAAVARLLFPDFNLRAGVKSRGTEPKFVPDPLLIARLTQGHFANLILTAAYSGLRWGELAALRRSDIDTEARTIRVERAWCAVSNQEKGPKTPASRRVVAYLPECHTALVSQVLVSGPFLFTMPRGGRLHASNFHRNFWRPTMKALGYSFTFHDLRHTYATLLLSRGVPVHLVSRMLGHSNPTVTLNVYAGLFSDAALTVAQLVGGTGARLPLSS
jgi:integrase